jgi:dipeptidase E
MNERHIFAIGNNFFLKGSEHLNLYRYILSKARKSKPHVLMIPTASGDAQAQIDAFQSCFSHLDCTPSVLSLFRGETADLRSVVMAADVIYVSGGNTRNLMTLWKDWGLHPLIREAYERGTVMAGGSAGSLYWFDEGVTDSIPGPLTAMKCMGILKGSNCPHYDGEVNRRPSYHGLLKSGELGAGYANEDAVALHFLNEKFNEAVTEHAGKHAYFVQVVDGSVQESPIPARAV